MMFKILGVPVPEVVLSDSDTTSLAVGVTELAPVVDGTFTKKSLLLISPEEMVANEGAPDVVALRYCPVVPLAIEDKVSAADV